MKNKQSHIRHAILVTFLLIFTTDLQGQEEQNYQLPRKWTRLTFDSQAPANYYSKLFIVTNRRMKWDNDSADFGHGMSRRTPRHFFIAYFHGESATIVPKNEMSELFDNLHSDKEILYYVNGHGKNFYQMLYRSWEVEKLYDVNVILFDWPTDNIFLSSTIGNAKKSTINFSKTLTESVNYGLKDRKTSIIFHSMGNHVIKSFIQKNMDAAIPDDYFDNIILSSAAVKHNRHAKWVEEIDFSERIYLTFNNNDRTLQGASILRFKRQLGLEPSNPYAQNALYLDFTPVAGSQHTFFIDRNGLHKNQPVIKDTFEGLFHGKSFQIPSKLVTNIIDP